MRSLSFEATEKIDPKTQDAYFKTFGQTLSDSHMAAMTAILGWTSGEDLQVRGTGTWFGSDLLVLVAPSFFSNESFLYSGLECAWS